MEPRLILATANGHKAAEMQELLAGCGHAVLAAPPTAVDAEETGETFAENARIKALSAARVTGEMVLADDSGLCVDALGGKPGIHSHRWAGPDAADADRTAKLLEALQGVPSGRRGARFICAMCIAGPGGTLWEGQGIVEGRIAETPRGDGGFGYDPVFLLSDGRSMAELEPVEKNGVSHRGHAARAAAAWLRGRSGQRHNGRHPAASRADTNEKRD